MRWGGFLVGFEKSVPMFEIYQIAHPLIQVIHHWGVFSEGVHPTAAWDTFRVRSREAETIFSPEGEKAQQ